MYLRILKKDLRRKKAMNIILLAFILLASMFVSSSANNIITLSGAKDDFMGGSITGDYFFLTRSVPRDVVEDMAEKLENKQSCIMEDVLFISRDMVKLNGSEMEKGTAMYTLFPLEGSATDYFGLDNEPVTAVEPGTILLPAKLLSEKEYKVGDLFAFTVGDTVVELEVAGFVKDALLGPNGIGMTRCLAAKEDIETLQAAPEAESLGLTGCLTSFRTDAPKALAAELMDSGVPSIMAADRAMISSAYLMDMVIAGIFLVISAVLMVIAMVVLRFTINFTLSQEYREIGVMKAIGIPRGKIKGLYLVKYLALSILGGTAGFFLGIPFGKMLLESASDTMVIRGDAFYTVNALCVLAVIAAVMLFCRGCTGRVDKLSPIDAVRDGSAGERFSKRSPISLSGSPMRPVPFMALNDVLCDLKRYAAIMIAFTLCLLLTVVVINSINTLKSEKMVSFFGSVESDAYITISGYVDHLSENGRESLKKALEEMEDTLAKEGMETRCVAEMLLSITAENGENRFGALVMQGTGTTADEYVYSEGTAPQSAGEVAVTSYTAEMLDVSIGDTFILKDTKGDREVLVTGIFQSMMNMGNGVRVHEDEELDYSLAMGMNSYQVEFLDDPDEEEIERRMTRLAELYPESKVMDGGEYADFFMGSATIVASIRNLLVPLVIAICMMIAMLMERSFIAKETGEIAMLKATGFSQGAIVRWHTQRMGIVLVISTLLSLILSTPATQLLITPIFRMMGADSIQYDIVPLEAYVLYPALMIGCTLIAVTLTALSTRKITASQTSSIE